MPICAECGVEFPGKQRKRCSPYCDKIASNKRANEAWVKRKPQKPRDPRLSPRIDMKRTYGDGISKRFNAVRG